MEKQTILIISGPTASGKTSLAIKCAKKFNGEIISCDSMQIYKHLDIGTAKATIDEQKEIKHNLIDIVNPNEEFSVQEYVKYAKDCINKIIENKKLPIIVGGTGLYIKSLINPYSFCEAPKDEKIRNYYKKLLEEKGKEFLYTLLQDKDIEASKKIHMNDTKRVIRALEICEITQNKKSVLNSQNSTQDSQYNVIFVILSPDRETLYEKINIRVEEMFSLGLLEEFESVKAGFNLNQENQSMQAIGYKELFLINEEKSNINEIKELIKQHTRNYAKRQITFMKGFREAKWFTGDNKEEILNFIKNNLKKEV